MNKMIRKDEKDRGNQNKKTKNTKPERNRSISLDWTMCVNKSSLIFQSNYRTSITSQSKNSSLLVFVRSFLNSFSSFQFNSVPWICFDLRFIYYISTKEFEKILITIEWNWWLIHYFLFLFCCARSVFFIFFYSSKHFAGQDACHIEK